MIWKSTNICLLSLRTDKKLTIGSAMHKLMFHEYSKLFYLCPDFTLLLLLFGQTFISVTVFPWTINFCLVKPYDVKLNKDHAVLWEVYATYFIMKK